MPPTIDPKKYPIRLEGDFSDALFLVGARIEEGISQLTRTYVEFVCSDRMVDLEKLLGRTMKVVMQPSETEAARLFPGVCTSVEFLGTPTGPAHYMCELRPWLWFLTRSRNNRIFQSKNVPDILQEVLTDHGFWGDVEKKLNGTYDTREYVVQYRESDFDFVSRLMEEAGIYYFFVEKDGKEKMILADGVGSHQPIKKGNPVTYIALSNAATSQADHVFDWRHALDAVGGKVTLRDFNFEKPGAKMESVNAIPKGTHPEKDHERYDYPGHFRETALGDTRARVRMEAEAVTHKTARGAGNLTTLGVGETFTLKGHGRTTENTGWMLTQATHLFRLTVAEQPPLGVDKPLSNLLQEGFVGNSPYNVQFEVVPDKIQYRAPLITPWPEIVGVHTAIVTGPSGEEIHTDKYGRVKVQFHWDRKGKKDDKTTCFVRHMTPWSGKNWGMIHIPRIGQEVVVQFEEGDPDRPLIIGMLYNADTMPPYALPANKTQSGIKTNSSKKGGGFNELMFEDKKGAELVRFRAEHDYVQMVQNDATITVGLEDKSKGDMSLTVHNDLTEILKEGNHSFTVEKGKQDIAIKKDRTKTVEGNQKNTITGNLTERVTRGNVSYTIDMGNETHQVKMGNVDYKIDMGNVTWKLGMGNYTIQCSLGKITMEALQSIEFKVMGSSIKIDPMGVTIKGMMIKIDGQMMTEVKGGIMTKVEGGALLMAKGGITMIN